MPASAAVRLDRGNYAGQVNPACTRGFAYYDCWGDDSRLVIANAQDAAEKGATVLTRTRCVRVDRRPLDWHVQFERSTGPRRTASAIVNATGSWTADFLQNRAGVEPKRSMRLVKGSHIVIRRRYPGDHAYILPNSDKWIIFVIPYEDDFSLIGTTDVEWGGKPTDVSIDAEEIDYLCCAVNTWLRQQIAPLPKTRSIG